MHDSPPESFPQPFGSYLLLDRVAEGGMSEIFLAVQQAAQGARRFVTVKRIRTEYVDDPDFIDFFLTEGRVSLRFSHPNLPQVIELGQQDDLHYLAMEYIRGHNLLDIIRASIRAKQPLTVNSVLTIALGVSAALEHAHQLTDVDGAELGVIHRDVTPQNIMVSTAGVTKLIDFGIVRSAIQVHKTRTGIVKGKLAYMAPEQIEGRAGLDHRADLFALGIVMWESLIGRPLFRGRSELETVERTKKLVVPDPRTLRPEIPAPVSAVVLKMLERDPDERYPHATALLAALEQVAEHCRMVPSMTRLRREVTALCGIPPIPEVPPADPDELAEVAPTVVDSRTDLESALADELDAPAESGLRADPLLLYFLRQTGARLPARDRAAGAAALANASKS